MIAMFSEKLRVEHIEHLVYVKGLFVLKCFIIEGNNFIRKQHIERLWVCSVVMLLFPHMFNDCVWWCGNIHTYIYIGGWKVIGVGSASEIEWKRVWERAWQLE